MVNDRLAGQAEYVLEWDRDLDFTITAYRHDFSRVWTRLNGFERGPDLYTLLSNPDEGQNRVFFDVLTGAADSSSTAEALRITANDREFVSQGVQALARHRHKGEGWTNSAEFGVRVHADEIERDHTERRYSMQAGALVSDGSDPIPTTRNRGSAQALSFHFIDQIGLGAFTFAPGVRAELIQTELFDRLDGQTFENGQNVLLPGAGLHWALTNEFGFLAGVHRGFSPVPPQRAASSAEAEEVEPETSLNYEAGARYYDAQEGTLLELVGFLNDYQNLTGLCSFSSGCPEEQLDQQFNAGEATVYGVELAADHNFGGEDLRLPVRLAYTFTQSRFDTSFASDDPQFGDVTEGDALPYVPEHQGSLRLGVEQAGEWSFHAAGTYVSPMLESAGLFDDPDALITDAQAFVDLKGELHLFDGFTVYGKLDNALDARPIAARRPFGARPIRPFLAQIGTRFEF
jgi:Fe(3+) dicitrate transport protein